MPIYCYECSCCKYEFEEYRHSSDNSGKALCHKCGNNAFKIPAIFNANIFKPRKFGDGTETPHFVSTPKQEKAWLKSEGITLDAPTGNELRHRKEERKIKSQTVLEKAFKDAVQKTEQGFKIRGVKQRKVKKEVKLA